jgi:hypothetical protein
VFPTGTETDDSLAVAESIEIPNIGLDSLSDFRGTVRAGELEAR